MLRIRASHKGIYYTSSDKQYDIKVGNDFYLQDY
jgi:hypothetical protein